MPTTALKYHLRSNYDSQQINKHMKNPKQLWKSINEMLTNKTAMRTNSNQIFTNKRDIANICNDFFIDVGKNSHDQIPTNIEQNINTMIRIANSIMCLPTDSNEICHKIRSMKICNNTNEIISSRLLKKNSYLLAPILSKLINKCLTDGIFPDELKIAPIFKDSDPLLPTN